MSPEAHPPSASPAPDSAAGGGMDFARQVAKARHDLRNPLSHILGFTAMLIEKAGQQGLNFIKSRLQLIERSANELVLLVNLELDPARLTAGEGELGALLRKLNKLGTRIVQTADGLRNKPAVRQDEAFQSDLARIRGAAEKLIGMAEPTLSGLANDLQPATATPHADPIPRAPSGGRPPGAWTPGRLLVQVELLTGAEGWQRTLEQAGHTLQWVDTAAELVDQVQPGTFDLVLLGCRSATANQGELLNQLQEAAAYPPAILIVCEPDHESQAARCLEHGIVDYIAQPIDAAVLRARVEGCLARRYLRQQESRPPE